MQADTVYKICSLAEAARLEKFGTWCGNADDVRDGFIHLSTRAQLPNTAAKHFSGQTGLLVLELSGQSLGPQLRVEASKSGKLYPHFYGTLTHSSVTRRWPLEKLLVASDSIVQ